MKFNNRLSCGLLKNTDEPWTRSIARGRGGKGGEREEVFHEKVRTTAIVEIQSDPFVSFKLLVLLDAYTHLLSRIDSPSTLLTLASVKESETRVEYSEAS
jgi:hypothetical protein